MTEEPEALRDVYSNIDFENVDSVRLGYNKDIGIYEIEVKIEYSGEDGETHRHWFLPADEGNLPGMYQELEKTLAQEKKENHREFDLTATEISDEIVEEIEDRVKKGEHLSDGGQEETGRNIWDHWNSMLSGS